MWDWGIVLRLRKRKMSRISDHVTYREYQDQTFILDTQQHLSFRIDAPVGKLLDLFVADTTAEDAKEHLTALYPKVPYKVLSDDVDAIIRFLTNNGLFAQERTVSGVTAQKSHVNTRFFQRYTIRERLLYSALFEVTYRCPERCVHCYLEPSVMSEKYAADSADELTADEIGNVLEQLAEMNVMDVTFTGGEPFVRGDMFEILELAHTKRFAIEIFSNGILLDGPGIMRLSRLRLHCFHSSIYSHIPEKHDHITGVTGSFDKTVHILRELSDRGVYVNLKFVLMEQNKDDLQGVTDLAKSMGATVQLISAVSPSVRGSRAITDLGVKSEEDLRRVIRQWNMISDFQSYTGEFFLMIPFVRQE